jgi:hypothetical protein
MGVVTVNIDPSRVAEALAEYDREIRDAQILLDYIEEEERAAQQRVTDRERRKLAFVKYLTEQGFEVPR